MGAAAITSSTDPLASSNRSFGLASIQWANRHPYTKEIDKSLNKGWPGCCRPPKLGEMMDYIDEIDWPIVAKRYGMRNPYEAKHLPQKPSSMSRSSIRSNASITRGSSVDLPKEDKDVRNRNSSSPNPRSSPRIQESVKGSPRREADDFAPANGPLYRAPTRPNSSQQSITTTYVVAEERPNGMYHTRRIPQNVAIPPVVPAPEPQTIGRSSSLRPVKDDSSSSSSSSNSSSSVSSASSVSSNEPRSLSDINKGFAGMTLSSTGSNRDSITTLMSDGAFTDYLSDESEAELQRQAEVRAAQLRRLRAEEAEFNAARRGLADVGLDTPVAWNPIKPQPYDPSAYARR
ncbi:hypothetical protein FRB96_000174 [Tulasnella sp. 330]|nr:hypothetical protein FRB96_000174 [Tulasnella sp. 330]KAG8885905.1 hypothetical protein FRB97_009067 [Tulasnella sp. 331]KAG8891077.1 hypothetical protein FRB98_000086 [Tulasnella sp. 332]